jgi:hypothetical protein
MVGSRALKTSRTGSTQEPANGGSVIGPQDISVNRIENASPGLAYTMRKYQSVFWHDSGKYYVLHVPKKFRDHRSYEYWKITKQQVEGADRYLLDGQPPLRWMSEAKPPGRPARERSLKGWGGKRSI